MPGLAETLAALSHNHLPSLGSKSDPGLLRETRGFGDNPGGLQMLTHTPDGLAQGAPLVVVLHGCTQTAEGYAAGAGWLELADRYGFAVLCPQQVRANNPNLCFNWFSPGDSTRGQGEAGSIRAMIAHMLETQALDPGRVFATGLSAGGAMANVLLATYPELFAGGAIIAGLPYGAAGNVVEALTAMRGQAAVSPQESGARIRTASHYDGPWPPVSVWQGEQDTTVVASVADEIVAQWVDVHGARTPPARGPAEGVGRRHRTWADARGETVVELHSIAGMGHGAPLGSAVAEGCGASGPYLLEVGVSSSFEIAERWGLTGVRRSPVRPAHSSDAVQAPQPQPAAAFAAQPGHEVYDVIAGALKRAGLMK